MDEFFEAGADDERGGAEGAEEAFVTGDGEEVDVRGLDIDRDVAGGLGGVDEDWNGHVAADLSKGCDGLERAGDVGGVDGGDEARVGRDGVSEGFGVDEACLGVGGDAGEGEAVGEFVGEGVEWSEDGVVLHVGGDGVDVFAVGVERGAEDALDGEVEGVGGVVCEDDVFGGFGVEERAEHLACFGEDFGGEACFAIGAAAGGGTEVVVEVGDGVDDGGGLGEGCGGVVEVEPGGGAGVGVGGGSWVGGSVGHIWGV